MGTVVSRALRRRVGPDAESLSRRFAEEGATIVEDELRQEFIIRAPSLSAERPQNSWEWYFLMQHSGAPTRLLDWTEGALIALYFAVRNKLDETDAAVWVLNPWSLNEHVLGWMK